MKNNKAKELSDLLARLSDACDSWGEAVSDAGEIFSQLQNFDKSSLPEEARDVIDDILRRQPDGQAAELLADDISELESILFDESVDEAS